MTAGGSAVVETLFPGAPHEMMSVYYMDGDHLVMTHYCDSGNQPKLMLSDGTTPTELKFEFASGTNVDPGKGMHIHGATIRPLERDVLEEEWAGWHDGKPAHVMKFHLARSAPSGAAAGPR